MKIEYPNQITFVAGCALEADYFYVAAYPDSIDPDETVFSHLLSYLGRSEEKWFYRNTDRNVVAVCVKKATATTGRRVCSLSKEGEIEIYSNKDDTFIAEKIPDAGLRLGTHGYVTDIREIGNSLYVCGFADQVYKREDDGTWNLITSPPLKIRSALDEEVGFLSSIDGTSNNDIYTCGDAGRLFHFDGNKWTQLKLKTDEDLNCVRCISPEEIWVCGNNGTLLKGNDQTGFKDVSSVDDNEVFWSLTKFQDKIYIATPGEEILAFDGKSIRPIETGFPSGLMPYLVDSVRDMLWSFSPKEIACFDGKTWKRINHPSNPAPD